MDSIRTKVSHFPRLNDPKLAFETETIITNLAAVEFDPIRQHVNIAETMMRKYKAALFEAQKGVKEMITLKDEVREALLASFYRLGIAFDAFAHGSKALYEKAGMPMIKQRAPLPPLTDLDPPKLSSPCKGALKSVSKRQNGAYAVVHMISPDPITHNSWTAVVSTRARHTFTGLSKGKYWVKVRMTGTKNVVESVAVSYWVG